MKQAYDVRLESARPAPASRDSEPDLAPVAISHRKNIIKMMEQLAGRRSRWDVFRDFVTMSAVALSKLDLAQAEAREKRYMECISRYTKEEAQLFPQMFAELTLAMEAAPRDVLGEVYMLMDLGNARAGQFFTPYHISELMAALSVTQATTDLIREKGFITLQEPTCGGGAMVIAFAQELRKRGINYQQNLHVTATDLDPTAAMMTYVQLALLHVPAIVINGNSLSLEEFEHWYTPAHILGFWNHKLARRDRAEQAMDAEENEDQQEESGMESSAPSA